MAFSKLIVVVALAAGASAKIFTLFDLFDNSSAVGACHGNALQPHKGVPLLDYICDRIGNLCACGRASEIRAAAARTVARSTSRGGRPRKICAIVRTYDGHASKIQPMLETLLASVRAADRGGLVLEAQLLNTDKNRKLGQYFHSRTDAGRSELDYSVRLTHYKDPDFWIPPEIKSDKTVKLDNEYGYVATDLALLNLRKRGGCDFILVTNGDNLYHIDFVQKALYEMDSRSSTKTEALSYAPDSAVAVVAVNYWCHYHGGKVTKSQLRLGKVDLGAIIFRAAYLDAKNETFLLGAIHNPAELKQHWRIVGADGYMANRVRSDLGDSRAKVIDETLFFHI